MKITKIGHCCLLIEVEGKRILTDPGSFTIDELIVEHIDMVLITHEHADHIHIESLQRVIEANPDVVIVTNTAVGKLLTEVAISYQILEGKNQSELCGVYIEAYDEKHAEIYEEIGQVQNTGYFIANRLFYPGDSYTIPGKEVEILAFPIGGPWCKIADAIRYVLEVMPKKAFPVHDGIERMDRVGILHHIPNLIFPENGIECYPLKAGDTAEF